MTKSIKATEYNVRLNNSSDWAVLVQHSRLKIIEMNLQLNAAFLSLCSAINKFLFKYSRRKNQTKEKNLYK